MASSRKKNEIKILFVVACEQPSKYFDIEEQLLVLSFTDAWGYFGSG